jgi:hypothetical protein
VLHAYVSSLYRDAKFTPILINLLDTFSDVTPLVKGELLHALSIQNLDEEGSKDFLKRAENAIENDKRGYAVTRRRTYSAVGNLDGVSAWEWLMKKLEEEQFGECKESIISALASK